MFLKSHLYDPQCKCVACCQFEIELKKTIQKEKDYRPHWSQLGKVNRADFSKEIKE